MRSKSAVLWGYTGRGVNAFRKGARDPLRTSRPQLLRARVSTVNLFESYQSPIFDGSAAIGEGARTL